MKWNDIAADVVGLGAPVLGAALGGPLGEAAGRLLGEVLGVPQREPDTVKAALPNADPAAVTDAEKQWVALVRAEAETQRAIVAETHQTIRAEMSSNDPLQRWWRPLYAVELTVECAALWGVVIARLWHGDVAVFNALVAGALLLAAYWGFRFGVLGVYVSGRTREKLAATTGVLAPGVLEQIVAALRRKS